MDYKNIITQIIALSGGDDNISVATHCITRLRLAVKDLSKVNKKDLEHLEGTLGLIISNNELQIIFGPGKVNKAYDAMQEVWKPTNGDSDSSNSVADDFKNTIKQQKDAVKSSRTTKFQGFMSKFSNIFVPLIPGFIAAGIMAGFAGLLTELGVHNEFVNYLIVFNKSLTMFMYIMIGFNSVKAFGGTGVIGGILAGLFLLKYDVHGNSGMTEFLSFTIDPRGGMIGIIISCIISAKLETFVRKRFSYDATDIITTPMITMLIMGCLIYIIIMPVSYQLFKVMNYAFLHLNGNPIGGGILAGLFLPSVMLGIHQGFVPVYQGLIKTTHMNSLFPILAMAGAGQVGASLALYVRSAKDSNLRKNIRGAIIPGFLGIGEPLIYGVTLPRVKPFFTSMAGGLVGGVYIGLMAKFGFVFGLNTVFGSSGLLGSIAMTSNHGVIVAILLYLSALVISYIAGFIFTILWGTKNVDLS